MELSHDSPFLSTHQSESQLDLLEQTLKAADLADKTIFVLWKAEQRTSEQKPTKRPYTIHNVPASVADCNDWSTFDECKAALEDSPETYSGLGIVLTGDELVGFDFDDVIDQTGVLEPEVSEFVKTLNSYTEISPSGRGLRVLVRGRLPGTLRRRGHFEVYNASRYLTLTGNHLSNSPCEIRQNQSGIEAVYKKIFGSNINGKEVLPKFPTKETQTDTEFLEVVSQKIQDCLKNDWKKHGFPSASEADVAVCSELLQLGATHDQVVRIVRNHPLGQRLQNGKPKWARDDYVARTLLAACRVNGTDRPARDVEDFQLQTPEPLTRNYSMEDYPICALPGKIRAVVEEVQNFTQVPIALVAGSALGALSIAAQAHGNVRRNEKLSGPVSLFILTIAPSGERKTTVDALFSLEPIHEYQKQKLEDAQLKISEHKAKLRYWEAEVKAVTGRVGKKNATGSEKTELQTLEKEKPIAPRIPSPLRGDDTPENLGWSLANEWPSVGILSSEAALVFGSHGMGRESVLRNIALLNVLWDGGTHRVGRRTSESYTVDKNARLTLCLQIQSEPLIDFLEQSGGLARGMGFLARFLFAMPESTQGSRFYREPPANTPSLNEFNTRIREIFDIQQVFENYEQRLPPLKIFLSLEAKELWIKFHDVIEAELRSGGELQDIRDVASKAADNAARLSALFHIFENGIGGEISAAHFESASRIVAWHLTEARRFLGMLALPQDIADAVSLEHWIVRYCHQESCKSLLRRDIHQRVTPVHLRDGELLDRALGKLVEHGRIQIIATGRRKEIYIHPSILDEKP